MASQSIGNLFIVAAPSGGGKTSLVRRLLEQMTDIEVSISHTTRSKRPNETDGKDYIFVDETEFKLLVADLAFVEHAKVFGHYYGTSKQQIYDRLERGIDVVLDIDWQGAQQIKKEFKNAVGIFIIPPSLEALKDRLLDRNQDNQAVISQRMKKAQDELSHYTEFDYLIVNDQFDVALSQLIAIIKANRLLLPRQTKNLNQLIGNLLSGEA